MSNHDNRHEPRYSINFPLLYSPASDSFEKNLGARLFKAVSVDMSLSGLAFDVDKYLKVGEKISVFLNSPEEDLHETLNCEVCWCRSMDGGNYRIGVTIVSMKPGGNRKHVEIGSGEMPREIDHLCPSCRQAVTYHFIGYQSVISGKIDIPLYNCGECNTTRSLTGLLRH